MLTVFDDSLIDVVPIGSEPRCIKVRPSKAACRPSGALLGVPEIDIGGESVMLSRDTGKTFAPALAAFIAAMCRAVASKQRLARPRHRPRRRASCTTATEAQQKVGSNGPKTMREMIQANGPIWLAVGGFLIGAVFGALVYRTNFCTMGALSDIVNLHDWRRMRAWLLAIATAIAGAQILDAAGVVELKRSMYLAPRINWAGSILGGLMFGYGMVFAGGCASRNLARVGGGDLRALVTLMVVGLGAYMAIGGIVAPARSAFELATSVEVASSTQAVGDLIGQRFGLPTALANKVLAAVLVLGIVLYCVADADFRSSPNHIVAGLGIGSAAVAGWALTGLAFDEFAERPTAPISLTFVRPSGDALEWLGRYTAAPMPGFGVATVFGTIFGAFLTAKLMGRFRLTTFADTGDTVRNLLGALLMGVGGVMALGCTVGQAITGMSTLAVGSFLTFAAIVTGGICGLKMLERWLMAEA